MIEPRPLAQGLRLHGHTVIDRRRTQEPPTL
jgi:hypothetical protein